MIGDRDDVREIASSLVEAMYERASARDASGTFPEEDFEDLTKAGLLGLMVPTHLGGLGCSFLDYAPVALALGRGNGSTALIFNMHASVTGALALAPESLMRALGANESWFLVRDELLKAAVGGSRYGVAMSERRAGSRLSALESTYRRVDDGYELRAEKSFVSGAGHVDAYLVAARSVESSDRVSFFIVPTGEGVRVTKTWDALGMRATSSDDVSFNCVVEADALVGGVEGIALLVASTMPQWLVASYAAVYVGVARSAIDACVIDLTRRKLAHLPSVRARIGRADASVAAAELAVYEAARLVEEAPGERTTNRAVYRAKLLAGDTAAEVCSSMLEAAGASATRRGHPLERLYRDARCGALQPATSDVCADWLGVAALGGDPAHVENPRW